MTGTRTPKGSSRRPGPTWANDDNGESTGPLRREIRSVLELFGLCGLAIAQPILDIFGRSPEQFVFRGVGREGLVAFALAVVLVPPAVLWAAEVALQAVSGPLRRGLHLGFVGVLSVALMLQVLLGHVPAPIRLLMALGVGVGAVVAYRRFLPFRSWVAYCAPATIVFLILFLVLSPTADLLKKPDSLAVRGGIADPAPVVMLVFDELPLASIVKADGSIDAELYPNLAALAEGSHWYRNTTSVGGATSFAAPALLTGQAPVQGRGPTARDHPNSLFTLLGDFYEMHVVESVTRLCPTTVCDQEGRGGRAAKGLFGDAAQAYLSRLSYSGPKNDPVFSMGEATVEENDPGNEATLGEDEVDDLLETMWSDSGKSQPARLDGFLTDLTDISGSKGSLHYLHLLLPHAPWNHLPSGERYPAPFKTPGRENGRWTEDSWPVTQARQRHLLQVGYVDRLVGQITDKLQELGVYDDVLLVLTSDHGASFLPGGSFRGNEGGTLTAEGVADLAWVPLFLKEPGQETGTISDANVLTMDVVPSVADSLGIEIPWPHEGQSVFGPPRSEATKVFTPGLPTASGKTLAPPVQVDEITSLGEVFRRGTDSILTAGTGHDRFWRVGPNPELLGLQLTEAQEQAGLDALDIQLADADALDIAPDAAEVPALVRGEVANVPSGTPVAVVLNGVVAATGRTWKEDGKTSFSAMVPPAAFRAGPNDVTVYRIV